MGRAGRRERREQRKLEQWERESLAELEKQAGLAPRGESDEVFVEAEFDQHDEIVPRATVEGPDPWRAARLGTVRDVAQFFRVHWKTVEIWRRKDGLPCVRQGGVIRYVLSDVLRWTSERKAA